MHVSTRPNVAHENLLYYANASGVQDKDSTKKTVRKEDGDDGKLMNLLPHP